MREYNNRAGFDFDKERHRTLNNRINSKGNFQSLFFGDKYSPEYDRTEILYQLSDQKPRGLIDRYSNYAPKSLVKKISMMRKNGAKKGEIDKELSKYYDNEKFWENKNGKKAWKGKPNAYLDE